MKLRYCLPFVPGRGVGLGNELIPWARAFVASTVLDATLLSPAFGLNHRRYWRHFGTPRLDWIYHRALHKTLRVIDFDEPAFHRYGGGSLSQAIFNHAQDHGLGDRSSFVWTTQGMWGGYHHVIEARDFVRATLHQSRFAPRNLQLLRHRLDPEKLTIGMHVRLGDFQPANDALDYRNRFNASLPSAWYLQIAKRIRDHLGQRVQFLVVSDGTPDQIAAFARPLDAVTTYDIPDSDCSDLLALATSDLLVCSVSSYSAWAAFLSDSPYLWFAPNLTPHPEGVLSIWGHEPRQREPLGATAQAIQRFGSNQQAWYCRGQAVDTDGAFSLALLDSLVAKHLERNRAGDLVTYGVVPCSGRGG